MTRCLKSLGALYIMYSFPVYTLKQVCLAIIDYNVIWEDRRKHMWTNISDYKIEHAKFLEHTRLFIIKESIMKICNIYEYICCIQCN